MRARFGCGLLLILAGCSTTRVGVPPAEFALDDQDAQFAGALAHYGQGLILEQEEGLRSPSAAEHLTAAAELDTREYRLQSKAALAQLAQGRTDDAIQLLKEAHRRAPRDLVPLLDLATVFQLSGRPQEAVEPYRKALRLAPDSPPIRVALSRLYFGLSQDQAALKTIEQGLAGVPDPAPLLRYLYDQAQDFMTRGQAARAMPCLEFLAAHLPHQQAPIRHQIGELHMLMGNGAEATNSFQQAALLYETAIQKNPNNSGLYSAFASLQFRLGDDAKAIENLQRGLDATDDPKPLLSLIYRLAQELVADGEPRRAIPCFELVARNVEQDRSTIFNLIGELYLALGDEAAAIQALEQAVADDHPDPASFIQLALLQGRKDAAQAVDTLRRGDAATDGDPTLLFALGSFYGSLGRTDEAMAAFDRVKQKAGVEEGAKLRASFFLSYGATCERSGHFDKAVEIFEECIRLYPREDEALNYLAYMWAEKGIELDKALTYIQRALAEEPLNGAYLDTLGWIYYRQGRHREALEQIQKAGAILADDPTLLDHLGDVHAALGETDAAREAWRRSFSIDPSNEAVADKLRKQGVNPDDVIGVKPLPLEPIGEGATDQANP